MTMIMKRMCAVEVALLLACLGGAVQGDDWPHDRGPNGNDISAETKWSAAWPDAGPKIAWKKNVGVGYSGAAIADGRCFTMGNSDDVDRVVALDAADGKELWAHEYACKAGQRYPGTRATPTVDGDRVYTFSAFGHLHCLDAKDGSVVWSLNTVKQHGGQAGRFGLACHPLVDGNRLYIYTSGKGGLLCLNKEDGKLIWKHGPAPGTQGFGSPHLYTRNGKKKLACFSDSVLWGLDPGSGALEWSAKWEAKHSICAATPLYVGDQVFVSTAYDVGCGMFRIRRPEAELLWKNKNMMAHFSNPILHDGHIYGASGDIRKAGALVCLEWGTGDVKWSAEDAFGPLLMAGDRLLVNTVDGQLVVAKASPDAYQELARVKIGEGEFWTAPSLSDGRLYCRSHGGELICVDLRGE